MASFIRNLFIILSDLSNTVLWMVSAVSLIYRNSSPVNERLGIFSCTSIIIGITFTFIFHNLFSSLAKFKYLFHFPFSLIIPLLFSPLEFFTSVLADDFSLEFEWLQVSSGLQESSQQCCRFDSLYPPPNSKSSRPFNNPLVIVPNAPITIGIIVTFMFHSLFNSLARSRYLSFFSLSFRFILWSAGTAKSTILKILFFVDHYEIWSSGRDQVIRLYIKVPLEFMRVIF